MFKCVLENNDFGTYRINVGRKFNTEIVLYDEQDDAFRFVGSLTVFGTNVIDLSEFHRSYHGVDFNNRPGSYLSVSLAMTVKKDDFIFSIRINLAVLEDVNRGNVIGWIFIWSLCLRLLVNESLLARRGMVFAEEDIQSGAQKKLKTRAYIT